MKVTIKDIDAYIELQPENVRDLLQELRQIIKTAVPEAEELISYQMPAFRFHGRLVWFAVFKNHYSIFVRQQVLDGFKDQLKPFGLSKSGSAIKIPYGTPIPVHLLTEILKTGAKANLENAQLKIRRKK